LGDDRRDEHRDAIDQIPALPADAASQICSEGCTDQTKSLPCCQCIAARQHDFEHLILIGDPILSWCFSMTGWIDVDSLPSFAVLEVRLGLIGCKACVQAPARQDNDRLTFSKH